MKTIKKAFILGMTLTAMGLTACNRDRAPAPEKKFTDIYKAQDKLGGFSSPVASPAKHTACENLSDLESQQRESSEKSFQFLSDLDLTTMTGGTNLAHSPFIQMFLGEKALLKINKEMPNEDLLVDIVEKKLNPLKAKLTAAQTTFNKAESLFQEAKSTFESIEGEPSDEQKAEWAEAQKDFKIASVTWQKTQEAISPNIKKLEYLAGVIQACMDTPENTQACLAVNNLKWEKALAKLEVTFPGILGKSAPLFIDAENASLAMGLIQKTLRGTKIEDLKKYQQGRLVNDLQIKAPLFASQDWTSLDKKESEILSSAKDALLNTDINERLCGLVLWQRSFSQLLSIKGYLNNNMDENGDEIYTHKVSPVYGSVDVNGRFLEAGKTKVTTEKEISAYTPARKAGPLFLTQSLKNERSANLSQTLSFVKTLAHYYEVTSPVAPWTQKTKFIGPVDKKNAAIVPYEAHALALGLLSVQFQNVAGMNVKKLDGKGIEITKDSRDGEGQRPEPKMALIGEIQSDGQLFVTLDNTRKLLEIVAQLQNTLQQISKVDSDELKQTQPLYNKVKLAGLIGVETPEFQEKIKVVLSDKSGITTLFGQLYKNKFQTPRENFEQSLTMQLQKFDDFRGKINATAFKKILDRIYNEDKKKIPAPNTLPLLLKLSVAGMYEHLLGLEVSELVIQQKEKELGAKLPDTAKEKIKTASLDSVKNNILKRLQKLNLPLVLSINKMNKSNISEYTYDLKTGTSVPSKKSTKTQRRAANSAVQDILNLVRK